MRLLITGATGFIGKNLFRKFCFMGYQVCGISKSGGMINDIVIEAVDCTDQEAVNCYCEGKSFDGIIHLAASIPTSFYDERARHSLLQNLRMTMNLLEVFRRQSRGIFVYASSTSIYGYPRELPVTEEMPAQPNNFYSIGKFFGEVICEQYRKEFNLPVLILRISAPYGPGMRNETVVKKFIKKALLSEDITLYGTGNRSQDFIYIEDLVDAIVKACEAKATGIFNISSGISTSMRELAETILRVLPNSKSKIVYAGIDDPQENYRGAYSFEKARKAFNYEPKFTLEMGIKEYAKAIRKELGL